jgi:Endonuclease/Exonuclease/phosphatase family
MGRVQVMTWNLENLFLPGQDGGPDSEVAFEAKLASLAAVIDQVAPDVAAVQEVGPDPVLARLQATLNHQLPHAATGDPDDRGIRVALLSAHPLAEVTTVGLFPPGVRAVQTKDEVFDDPSTPVDEAATREMGRSALAATIQLNGTPLTVVTAHFKSKLINYARKQGVVGGSKFAPNDEGERLRYAGYAVFRRTGEAMTVRAHLDELLADPADATVGLGRERAVGVLRRPQRRARRRHHRDRCRPVRLGDRPHARVGLSPPRRRRRVSPVEPGAAAASRPADHAGLQRPG